MLEIFRSHRSGGTNFRSEFVDIGSGLPNRRDCVDLFVLVMGDVAHFKIDLHCNALFLNDESRLFFVIIHENLVIYYNAQIVTSNFKKCSVCHEERWQGTMLAAPVAEWKSQTICLQPM